jgi:two-component system, LytTR family, sensor kinase
VYKGAVNAINLGLAAARALPGRHLRLSGAEARALLGATLALWTANWGLLTLRASAEGVALWSGTSLIRLGLCAIGCGLCFLMHQLLSRWIPRTLTAQILVAALVAGAAAEAYGWINAWALSRVLGLAIQSSPGATILILGLYTWTFFAWTALYLALAHSAQARRAEQDAAELRALAQGAQLRALRYQLNPHFLFNALNSLSSLILDVRTGEANQMVERLAEFLRLSLATDPLAMIPLCDEIRLQQLYLGIEQLRFPDLQLELSIEGEAGCALVPALLLQPLVENAIKHGLSSMCGAARICVHGEERGDTLLLRVANKSKPDAGRDGVGLGLSYVRQRLEAVFGAAASLTTAALENGFEVRIELPLEKAR